MILCDTHTLVWAVAEPKRLSKTALSAIRRAHRGDGLAVSAISLWELGALVNRGRIQAYGTVEASVALLVEGVAIKPITVEIAAMAAQFPPDFPANPADRLIAATARIEGFPLVTRDERLRESGLLQTIW